MSFSDSLESLRKIDINDLDVNNLGSWPVPINFITCLILLVTVLGLGYYFYLGDLQLQLDNERAQEETLKQQFLSVEQQAQLFQKKLKAH